MQSQNFVYANLKFTFQGQISPLCVAAKTLFKYSARHLFRDISPSYSRQRAKLNWLDFHETLAFISASLIYHGLLCIVGWPSASKLVLTWEIHTLSLVYGSQRSGTVHQILIQPSVLGQVLWNHMGHEYLQIFAKLNSNSVYCIIQSTVLVTWASPSIILKIWTIFLLNAKERKQRHKKVPKVRT